MKRIGLKSRALVTRHQPTLETEAELRRITQPLKITRLHAANISLGLHMQADRARNRVRKKFLKIFFANDFMAHIDALFGNVLTTGMHQVSNIVQQAGDYYRICCPAPAGRLGTLQRMLTLGHLFTIHTVAARFEPGSNLADRTISLRDNVRAFFIQRSQGRSLPSGAFPIDH